MKRSSCSVGTREVLDLRYEGSYADRLGGVALHATAEAQALAVRSSSLARPSEPFPISDLLDRQPWRVRRRSLLADRESSLQASLMPSTDHEFTITIDETPLARESWEVAFLGSAAANAAVGRFRLCHEIGHTLFYRPPTSRGDRPRRVRPTDPAEEAFCDRFASGLLVDPDAARNCVERGATAVLDLAKDTVAPASAVLDSAVGARALAGVIRPGSDAAGPTTQILQAWNLPDSWIVWDLVPGLWPQVVSTLDASGRDAAYLAVASHGCSDLSLATCPWSAEAEALLDGYDLRYADMGPDHGDARDQSLGTA